MGDKILLVDDNVDFMQTAEEALRQNEFEVVTAQDGYAAADQLQKHQFNLMISDVVMPGMNGPQLFGYAKTRWPELKVIMVSGEATAVTKGRLKELGADGFLEKPVRMQKLLAMVKSEMQAPERASAEPKKRLLVADDNRDFLTSATEYLSTRGYEVTAVDNGSKAWRAVRQGTPFYAIILDINMPKMDGIETVEAIRQVDGGVNIIAVSGEALKDETEAIMESGANGFLAKPFSMDKLVAFVEKRTAPACSYFDRTPGHRPLDYGSFGGVGKMAHQFHSYPLLVCIIVLVMLALCGTLAETGTQSTAAGGPVEHQLDRLIRAVELDWGR